MDQLWHLMNKEAKLRIQLLLNGLWEIHVDDVLLCMHDTCVIIRLAGVFWLDARPAKIIHVVVKNITSFNYSLQNMNYWYYYWKQYYLHVDFFKVKSFFIYLKRILMSLPIIGVPLGSPRLRIATHQWLVNVPAFYCQNTKLSGPSHAKIGKKYV